MADVLRAMISSTSRDLPKHREQARDACLRQEFLPLMMEHLPPSPDDAVRKSLQLVDEADVYVLILGLRYGETPQGYDRSYTHLEYDRAVERGIPIIALLSSDEHVFAQREIDLGEPGERLQRLRAAVRERATPFSSADDLRALLIDGLSDLKPRLAAPSPASVHYVSRPATPPTPYIAHPYTLLDASGLTGRATEMGALTDWVSDPTSAVYSARLFVLVAIGGMGKSALTWRWFTDIAPHEMPELAGRVWWSFYETDATFANFVLRTLAYVTNRPIEELRELRSAEREDALLAVLDREPHLLVLDGLERLLLAYTRPDAARLADDDLDEQTANIVAGALGLPDSAAASYTGQVRLRLAADPRAGAFLRRLTGVRAARILVTSRLFPAELQTAASLEPIRGAAAYFLRGLSSTDAVALWRNLGGAGRRDDLAPLFATFDNYPLLIRALAGEVARFRRAPGDLVAWRGANPGFDPFSLPLVQRKSHVLAYALAGLGPADRRILETIAAFRAPTDYATLVALLVGHGKPCADERVLDRALGDLENRGLLGWDRRANRYDLHPVVRGVAWSGLDPDARRRIDENLVDHFASIPVESDTVDSLDQLAGPIELFHTLLRLGRVTAAAEFLSDRLWERLFSVFALREIGELATTILDDESMTASVADEDHDVTITVLSILAGLNQFFVGDPFQMLRFLDRARSAAVTALSREMIAPFDQLTAFAKYQSGQLAEAERMAADGRDAGILGLCDDLSPLVLGLVLARQGAPEKSAAWLTDHWLSDESSAFGYIALDELARAAAHAGDTTTAQALAAAIEDDLAGDPFPSVDARIPIIRGLVAAQTGDAAVAGELLDDALAVARTSGLVDVELTARLELARRHLRAARAVDAGDHLTAAIALAERSGHRLLLADLHNVRSDVALASDDRAAAVDAADAAYRAAWCDGPPYCYRAALDTATQRLAALGAPAPSIPPKPHQDRTFTVGASRPAPSLRQEDAALRKIGWPVGRDRPADPVAAVAAAGWSRTPNAVVAALAADLTGSHGSAVLARLLALPIPPRERLEIVYWLGHGGLVAAEPLLVPLLHADDPDLARRTMQAIVATLPRNESALLSVNLNGQHPLLDPVAPVPYAHVHRAAEVLGEPVHVVQDRLTGLLARLGMTLAPPIVAPRSRRSWWERWKARG